MSTAAPLALPTSPLPTSPCAPLPSARTAVDASLAHTLGEFRSAVSASFVPLEVTSAHADTFRGTIRATACDQFHLSEVAATDHVVERTPALISRSDRSYFKVSLMLAGRGLLVQDGRDVLLEPGTIAIYDTGRPYTLAFDRAFHTLVVMFPRQFTGLPPEMLAPLTAVPMTTKHGLGAVVATYLTQLGTDLDQLTGATGTRLAAIAMDLITTLLLRELGLDRVTADPHQELLGKIRTYIDQHLGAGDLGPTTIAAAHYISTRHLHALFQEQGTTVSTWVRTRRLEQCRRDLGDPTLADRAVSAIAARWGFVDAAHFSRAFKTAFDVSPSEYRSGC